MCGVSLRCLGRVASFTRHSIARTPARRILPAFLLGLSRVPRQMPSPAEQELWGRLASRRPYGRSVSASTTKHGQHGAGGLATGSPCAVISLPNQPPCDGCCRFGFLAHSVFHEGAVVLARCGVVTQAQPVAPEAAKHPSSRGFAPTPGDCFTDGQSRMFTAPRYDSVACRREPRLPGRGSRLYGGQARCLPFRGGAGYWGGFSALQATKATRVGERGRVGAILALRASLAVWRGECPVRATYACMCPKGLNGP